MKKFKNLPANNPNRAGEQATPSLSFGPFNRYSVYAVHAPHGLQWVVIDSENHDDIIYQCVSFEEAVDINNYKGDE